MVRRIHLVFGLLLFVVFTITGSYMGTDFPDKEAIPQELRLLMRSRHIYILFSSLMHILLGLYLFPQISVSLRSVQYLGSILLFMASGVLVSAFIIETYSYAVFSDISRYGIYFSLAGVILHLIGGLRTRDRLI